MEGRGRSENESERVGEASRRVKILTCAFSLSEASMLQSGCMPPAAAIAAPLSVLPARCQSKRAAAVWFSCVPFVTSSISGGMPVNIP